MKIAPFRLLTGRAASRPRDEASELGLNDGELSPRAKAKLTELLADLDRMRGEAERLSGRVRELEALADTDPLASLLNRRAFMRELTKALAFAERHGGPVSVIYLDLVGFKLINDTYGHRVGDAAIVHVGAFLARHVRTTDTVGRIGGDEFAIVLPRADGDQALAKAADLRTGLIAEPIAIDGARVCLDVSAGVHEALGRDTAESALRAADEAMYQDKRAERASKNRPEAVLKN